MARTDARVAYYPDLFGANNITGLTFSGSDLFCVVFVEGTSSVNVANMTCDVGGTSLPQVLAETATFSGRKIRAWAGTVTGTGTKTVQIGGSSLGSGILTIIATAHNGVSAVRGTPVAAFNSSTASPSVTISGTVSGDECMMLGMSSTDGNIIATSPAAEIAFTPSQATYYVLLEQAASGASTTIAGTWTGGVPQAYEVVGLALQPTVSGPSFTTQPGNQTVTAPNTASFSAVYTGTIAGHQWQVSTNGGSSWSNVSDGTGQSGGSGTGGTLTYTTTATAVSTGNHRNGYQYRCVLNPSGTPVNSNAATLTVTEPTATQLVLSVPDAAGLSGFNGIVLSAAAPGGGVTVIATPTGISFNGSGQATINVTGLGIPVGQRRWVSVTNSTGDPAQSPAPVQAQGPVTAS